MANTETLKTKVAKNLFWRLAERYAAQIVQFVVTIVLARILMPEVYGQVALITVFIAILNVFIDSGLGNALIQKKDADDLDFSSVFYFNMVMCSVLYVGMFFLAPVIASFYNYANLTIVIRVLSLSLIISGLKNVQQAYVSRHLQFKKFFIATIIGTVISAGVGIYLAVSGFGIWALVAQNLSNMFLDTVILWFVVKWKPKLMFSFARLGALFKYGWKLLASALLDTGYNKARQLVIGKMYSPSQLAYYTKGDSFPFLIVSNTNSAIDSVLFPVLSKSQDNAEKVKNMTRRAIKTSSYIMAPLMIGLAVVAPSVIKLLLTDKWLPAVPYLQIFCISYLFYPIHTANLNAMKALGRSDLFLILEVIKKVVGIAILLATLWFGVLAIALGLLASTFCSVVINSWPNKKLLGYSLIDQLKDIFVNFIPAILMGAVVFGIGYLPINYIVLLFIQVFVGAALYVAFSILLKNESFYYIFDIMKKRAKGGNKVMVEGKKKVLVLGCDQGTLSLTRELRRRDFSVVCADYYENTKTKDLADEKWLVSTNDMDTLEKKCREEGIVAVVAGASDFNIKNMRELCKRLRLPIYCSNDFAYEASTNKYLFKKVCKEVGAPIATDYELTDELLETDIEKIKFPVVVKPVDKSGNIGMSYCNNRTELVDAYKKARRVSNDPKIIVERCLHGREFCANYVIADGEPQLLFLSTEHYQTGRDANIYSIMTTCKEHLQQYREGLDQKVIEVFKKIGVTEGTAWVECILDSDGHFYLIEMAYRIGGDVLGIPFKDISGFDSINWMVDCALGIKHTVKDLPPEKYDYDGIACSYFMFIDHAGTIKEVNYESILQDPTYEVNIKRGVGYAAEEKGHIGVIRFSAKDADELCKKIEFINKNLVVNDENGDDLIIRFTDFHKLIAEYENGKKYKD